jgi:putative transcriptional regulator
MATIKVTRKHAEKAARAVDWAAIDAMSDEDVAEQIAANPDAAPDLTVARARLMFRLGSHRLKPKYKVRLLRRSLGLSQAQFAEAYCLPVRNIQNWEQGTREPDEATMAFLKVIAHRPEMVRRVLREK